MPSRSLIRSLADLPRSELVAKSLSLAKAQPAVFTAVYAPEALAAATIAQGGAVALAFASMGDALACKRRLEGGGA
jgi:hypothetical protein